MPNLLAAALPVSQERRGRLWSEGTRSKEPVVGAPTRSNLLRLWQPNKLISRSSSPEIARSSQLSNLPRSHLGGAPHRQTADWILTREATAKLEQNKSEGELEGQTEKSTHVSTGK